MKPNKYISVLFSMFLFSCYSAPPKQDKRTLIFSSYLKKEFSMEIPKDEHIYILIPELACKGCIINKTQKEIEWLLKKQRNNNFTIISSNAPFIDYISKNNINYLADNSGKLDRLNLDISNITVINTQNRAIKDLKSIATDDTNSIEFYVNKFYSE